MENRNQDEEEDDLGRGKRRKSRNPRYFNSDTVNALMSDDNQRNIKANDEQEPQDAIENNETPLIFEYVLTQYSLKQGLMKYGKLAEQATEKELSLIHKMDALQPLDPKILTEEEKKRYDCFFYFFCCSFAILIISEIS